MDADGLHTSMLPVDLFNISMQQVLLSSKYCIYVLTATLTHYLHARQYCKQLSLKYLFMFLATPSTCQAIVKILLDIYITEKCNTVITPLTSQILLYQIVAV